MSNHLLGKAVRYPRALLPPRHYYVRGTCLPFYREKNSALSSLVDSSDHVESEDDASQFFVSSHV